MDIDGIFNGREFKLKGKKSNQIIPSELLLIDTTGLHHPMAPFYTSSSLLVSCKSNLLTLCHLLLFPGKLGSTFSVGKESGGNEQRR